MNISSPDPEVIVVENDLRTFALRCDEVKISRMRDRTQEVHSLGETFDLIARVNDLCEASRVAQGAPSLQLIIAYSGSCTSEYGVKEFLDEIDVHFSGRQKNSKPWVIFAGCTDWRLKEMAHKSCYSGEVIFTGTDDVGVQASRHYREWFARNFNIVTA